RIGVQDAIGVAHNSDMAFPEQEIAAAQGPLFRSVKRLANSGLLHVAVARTGDAGGMQRHLHETRTIDAKAALAAPEIGRAHEALGNGDEVGLVLVAAAEVPP